MKIRQSVRPVVVVTICLCVRIWLGAVAEAATYYVAKTGNNQNACARAQSQSTPKATINAGLACLSAGDALAIGAGTYAESLTRIPSSVTIRALTRKAVTLKPSGTLFVVDIRDGRRGITLDGLVLDGSNVTNAPVKITGSSTGITLRNGVVKNTNGGAAACILVSQGTSDIVLANLEIYNCQSGSLASGPGIHGVYWAADHGLIENCRFHGFSGYGIQFYDGSGGSITGNTVRNNTIYDAPRKGGVFVGSSAKENLFSNNTVYDVNVGVLVRGRHNRIIGNDIESSRCGVKLLGSYNIITGNDISSDSGQPICNTGTGNSFSNNTIE